MADTDNLLKEEVDIGLADTDDVIIVQPSAGLIQGDDTPYELVAG